jgi:hypothetical protein
MKESLLWNHIVRTSALVLLVATTGCATLTTTNSEREEASWLPRSMMPEAVNAEETPPHVYHPAPLHSAKGRMPLETAKFWRWLF